MACQLMDDLLVTRSNHIQKDVPFVQRCSAFKRAAAMGHEPAAVLTLSRSDVLARKNPGPMTTDEFREAISLLSPREFEEVARLVHACVEENKQRNAGEVQL
jgi:hypothetical protein